MLEGMQVMENYHNRAARWSLTWPPIRLSPGVHSPWPLPSLDRILFKGNRLSSPPPLSLACTCSYALTRQFDVQQPLIEQSQYRHAQFTSGCHANICFKTEEGVL